MKVFIFIILLFCCNSLQANFCAAPGEDGDQTITGVVNTYYEATASVSAGATSITLGASSGAGESVTSGDLVLIIQMQDAVINSNNSINYGDGSSGRGYTSINNTGIYEFASVSSSAGSAITLASGLQNSYTLSPPTAINGQKTYQIIKVPQYQNATLTGTLTAPAWDGNSGGVFVIDVFQNLAGGGATINVDGLGFRGGAFRATGVATNTTQRLDYVANNTTNTNGARVRHAGKAEGIAGTPQFIYNGIAVVDTNGVSTADGYPNGDYGRGAPGNAGAGGNEWNNGNDSGGGGGGNFANGGNGGAGWNTNPATENVGGLGGAAFPSTQTRIVMGGGGGAGMANNANTPHGANGGGIVIVRTNTISANFTINANGSDGTASGTNDGGGAAGAGGSVVFTASSGLGGVSINATGGDGGNAWPIIVAAGQAHGPGGGGSGGFVIYSTGAGTPSLDVSQGSSGTTTTSNLTFGATDGSGGFDTAENINYPCAADIQVTKTDLSADYTPGVSDSYSITVTNNGPADLTGIMLSDLVPDGLTIGTISCLPASSCTSVMIASQQIDILLDIIDGGNVVVTIPITYSATIGDY